METKLQLIETSDYILALSDEEIKEGDLCYDVVLKIFIASHNYNGYNRDLCKKIIAHLPKNNSPELDLPLLPEIVVEDGELLPNFLYKNEYDCILSGVYGDSDVTEEWNNYKSATKVYSEADLDSILVFINDEDNHTEGELGNSCIDVKTLVNFIKSVKQPKTLPKWFIAEMDCGEVRQCMCENNSNCLKPVFKTQHTTKNGTTYLVGKYE